MKILYTILCLLAGHLAHSQTGEIYGRVLDEKKQPIGKATLEVWHYGVVKGRTVTGPDGIYLLKSLDSGIYQVIATHPGHVIVTINNMTVERERVEQNIHMPVATKYLKQMNLEWQILLSSLHQDTTLSLHTFKKNDSPNPNYSNPTSGTLRPPNRSSFYIGCGSVNGSVIAKHYRHRKGAFVQLHCDTVLLDTCTTDQNGTYTLKVPDDFCLSQPKRDAYYITMAKKGYRSLKLNIPAPGTGVGSYDITLRRKWWQSKK